MPRALAITVTTRSARVFSVPSRVAGLRSLFSRSPSSLPISSMVMPRFGAPSTLRKSQGKDPNSLARASSITVWFCFLGITPDP